MTSLLKKITGVGENDTSEGRPNRSEQKALTGGEPARFQGPTRGRVMPGYPEEGGLLECELRKAAGAGEDRGEGARGVGKRTKRRGKKVAGCGKRKEEGCFGGGLVGKERDKGRNSQSIECTEVRVLGRICSTVARSKWGKDLILHVLSPEGVAASGGLPRMLKCQGSLGPLETRSRCWVPRAAGVDGEESLPASVLCAAWRGVWAAADSALPRALHRLPPRRGVPAWQAQVEWKDRVDGGARRTRDWWENPSQDGCEGAGLPTRTWRFGGGTCSGRQGTLTAGFTAVAIVPGTE